MWTVIGVLAGLAVVLLAGFYWCALIVGSAYDLYAENSDEMRDV